MESYPRSPEFSRGSDKEKSESDSKKEKKIGGKVAETLIRRPAETRPDSLEPKNAESMWQRIANLAEKREIDKSILKPVENADSDRQLGIKQPDVTNATEEQIDTVRTTGTDRVGTKYGDGLKDARLIKNGDDVEVPLRPLDAAAEKDLDKEAPLESLSDDEKRETMRRFTAVRREAIEQELLEIPEGTPPPVESAADLAFLRYVEEQMAENADQPIDAVLNKAEQTTAGVIEASGRTKNAGEGDNEAGAASGVEQGEELNNATENAAEERPQDVPAPEPNDPENLQSPEDTENPIALTPPPPPHPTSGGAGGGSGNVPPPPPPPYGSTGGNAHGGPGGSGSSGGGSGGRPPMRTLYPVPGAMPPTPTYAGSAPYAAPVSAAYNTAPIYSYNLNAERRRAMVQGFLVGGILGYLIGRRRGRIKTEKRLLPIQKKLEKQVETLTETVAQKELAIRKQAADTYYKMKTLEEQRRFADTLAEQGRSRAVTAEARATTDSRTNEGRSATTLHHERQQYPSPRAERLGRLLVEAPAAGVLAGAAVGVERASRPTGVDFNKRVEDYTPSELNQAAEKIRVDNVTLREIRNEHRLDDHAMRRIITAYVEGRSVHEALNKELFDKELRYEQDPKYRQFETDDTDNDSGNGSANGRTDGNNSNGGSRGLAGSASASHGNPATAAAAAAIGLTTGENRSGTKVADKSTTSSKQNQKPTLSPQALAKVRRQQIAEVSVAGIILVGIAVALVALLV